MWVCQVHVPMVYQKGMCLYKWLNDMKNNQNMKIVEKFQLLAATIL